MDKQMFKAYWGSEWENPSNGFLLGAATSVKEVKKLIADYQRSNMVGKIGDDGRLYWRWISYKPDVAVIDYGSWSQFFFIVGEGVNEERA